MDCSIPLTQGKVTLVDECDYALAARFNWHAVRITNTWYAATHNAGRHTVYMHRLLLNAPPELDVDHVDHDGLNNRRSNIRLGTRTQNLANEMKHASNTSGYKGVCWDKQNRHWRASMSIGNRTRFLGLFDVAEDAARAYDCAARAAQGDFARTNF